MGQAGCGWSSSGLTLPGLVLSSRKSFLPAAVPDTGRRGEQWGKGRYKGKATYAQPSHPAGQITSSWVLLRTSCWLALHCYTPCAGAGPASSLLCTRSMQLLRVLCLLWMLKVSLGATGEGARWGRAGETLLMFQDRGVCVGRWL